MEIGGRGPYTWIQFGEEHAYNQLNKTFLSYAFNKRIGYRTAPPQGRILRKHFLHTFEPAHLDVSLAEGADFEDSESPFYYTILILTDHVACQHFYCWVAGDDEEIPWHSNITEELTSRDENAFLVFRNDVPVYTQPLIANALQLREIMKRSHN